MKKSVYSAEIDKCTEICYVLNCSFDHITDFKFSEEFFLLFCSFSNKKLSSVTDDTVSSWIEFADNKFDFLIFVLRKVFFVSI